MNMNKQQAFAILHDVTGKLALSRKEHEVVLTALDVLMQEPKQEPKQVKVKAKVHK